LQHTTHFADESDRFLLNDTINKTPDTSYAEEIDWALPTKSSDVFAEG
jgi:hypothetical protein